MVGRSYGSFVVAVGRRYARMVGGYWGIVVEVQRSEESAGKGLHGVGPD